MNSNKKLNKNQPSKLYKRAKTTPKRTYKRKVKQSPAPTKKIGLLGYLSLLFPLGIIIMFVVGISGGVK